MPFADLGSVVLAAFGAASAVTLRRYAAGSYDAATGQWTSGAVTTSSVMAAVQPLGPRELELLPENERTIEAVGIYTRSALLTSNVLTGQQADEIVWDGKIHKVVRVEDWTRQARYARAFAVRLGDG